MYVFCTQVCREDGVICHSLLAAKLSGLLFRLRSCIACTLRICRRLNDRKKTGDKVTKAWLQQNMDNTFGFPNLVRFSWSTCETLLSTHVRHL